MANVTGIAGSMGGSDQFSMVVDRELVMEYGDSWLPINGDNRDGVPHVLG